MNITFTLAEIKKAAEEVFNLSNGKKVWALHGEMGSGKTTFTHALCENLRVKSATGSPTYSIINEYESLYGTIYHIDLYRLKDEEEALEAGVEECILSNCLCLIEWPDRVPGLLPGDCFHILISVSDIQTRTISVV